jgi:predicted DNA-binding transcriptional regulator AlpA
VPRSVTTRAGHVATLRFKTMPTSDDKLTIPEVCDELKIARSTFNDWRAKRCAPKCIRLPNGSVRVRRSELNRWLESREEAA